MKIYNNFLKKAETYQSFLQKSGGNVVGKVEAEL